MSPIDFVATLLVQPDTYRNNVDGFYKSTGLEQFLNVVNTDKRGTTKLFAWFAQPAMERLLRDIHAEMDALSIAFGSSPSDVTPETLMEFDFEQHVTDVCREVTPKFRRILTAAVQTKRAAKENTLKDIEPIVTMIQAQAAKTRSQNNNLCAIPCSLYFLSSGMPRKVIDTLAHAGMCLSYNAVKDAHSALAAGHSVSWDNTHLSVSIHVEQRDLAPPKVQTGTTQLIYDLRGLNNINILNLTIILERRTKAGLITPGFEYVKDSPELKHPAYRPPPRNHRTLEYVLRTTKLDEGSSDGTIQVNENIYLDQLKYNIHDLDNTAVPSYNDQKTNTLIRSAQLLRMGDLSAILRLEQYQLAPGAFHVELNLSWLLLRVHRGNGADIGSLQYFIGLLAKVRLGSDKPDFETLVSLLMQVLTGAMLHYWEIESGMTIVELAKSRPSASQLLQIARRIFSKYASGVVDSPSDTPDTDNTFRNLNLLVHDTLLFYFLRTSISSGDFGRVELLLGTLTMMFTGGGSSNYQTELLHFIQNLKKVWPPDFANLVRDNALISTNGRTYVGVDKNAEFNINFQKHYFATKGLHASWDLLADLAPNIPLLRRLKTQFGEFLGAPWQGTRHTKVDCSAQIAKVKSKMKEFKLHLPVVQGCRVTENEVVDVVEMGASVLRKSGMKAWSKSYTTWLNGG
ncbi:hypothetical protein DFH07DRAFT_963722 [Mycena maculata]|uniref:DUF6589 domain-containing protein n=1 Tax=Mycena maculata TaxID=230809 RepID=A0AAD7N3Y2_9AGAR|nr:hypothetical protein DFH07DRAFT_963722 [Mycena maculata]